MDLLIKAVHFNPQPSKKPNRDTIFFVVFKLYSSHLAMDFDG